jgi:hypothetical protein
LLPKETPSPTPEDVATIIIDSSFVGTKAECVYEKLIKNGKESIINKLISGFDIDKSIIDLKFRVDTIKANGEVNYLTVNNRALLEITINEARLNDASLEIARTILHECFHAYIYGKYYQNELHTGLCPEPDFKRDFDNYTKKYGRENDHNYMADKYRSFMIEGLKTYLQNEKYYDKILPILKENIFWVNEDFMLECMTWGGLHNTNAWKEYYKDTQKEQYDNQRKFIINLLPKEKCEK